MKGTAALTTTSPLLRLLLPALVLGLAAAALAGDSKITKVADKSYTGAVAAGRHLAFLIKPKAGTIAVSEGTKNSLDPACLKAIARAPSWVQHQLREAFRQMSGPAQQSFAKVIVEATDKTVDEIAFLVAHTSAEDLGHITPALIKRNAELIYEADPKLDYADLVEYGVAQKGGDFHTTIKYRTLKDGKESSFELTRDDYYWWVVHPLLDMEYITTIDPTKGKQAKPPTGVAWREYLLAGKSAALSPRHHYMMRTPNTITDKDLAAMDFGAAAAHGSLRPSLVGPNEVIRAGKTDEPVLVHYSLSGGTCGANRPNPDGIYLVTTIPLEKAAKNGDSALLENVLLAGPGRTTMRYKDTVTHATCDKDRVKEARDFLIVRDRVPFGAATDPNETVLTKNSRGYKVLTSVAFAKLMDDGKLTRATKPFYNLAYNKIVVPSDQPRALYETLSKYRTTIEAFVKNGGSFELHGATAEKDDWSDLTMPGGFQTTKQTAANHLSTLSVYGNALLLDVMKGVKYLWTGVRRCSRFVDKAKCLKGDRLLKDSPDAIDRIGWWSSQMIDRSAGEYACLRDLGLSPTYCSTSAERSWYPQRIVPNHYGNCGEIQDVVGAASRAVLVPSMVTLSHEDHVWNEFYAGDDQWYPMDTGWSDTPMRVGDWSVSGDGSSGGGKENAAMLAWRGDGQMVNLLGRYKAKVVDKKIDYEYTTWLTVTVTVQDKNGKPVDGARVTLMTEWFYSAQQAVKAIFGVTGRDGKVRLRVGDKRNFYINIASPLGHYPKPMGTSYYVDRKEFELLVKKSEAVAEAKIARTFKLEGKDADGAAYKALVFPAAKEGTWPAPKKDAAYHRLSLSLSVPAEHVPQYNPLNRRSFVETRAKGKVDLYVTDRANYDMFKADKPFTAVVVKEGVDAAKDVKLDLPDDAERVVIVSNRKLATLGQLVQASLALEKVTPPAVTPPDTTPDEGDEGCSCGVEGAGGRGHLALVVLLVVLVWRRRREG